MGRFYLNGLRQVGLGLFGQKILLSVNICLTEFVCIVYVFSVLPTTVTPFSHTLKFDQKLANFGVKVQKEIVFYFVAWNRLNTRSCVSRSPSNVWKPIWEILGITPFTNRIYETNCRLRMQRNIILRRTISYLSLHYLETYKLIKKKLLRRWRRKCKHTNNNTHTPLYTTNTYIGKKTRNCLLVWELQIW